MRGDVEGVIGFAAQRESIQEDDASRGDGQRLCLVLTTVSALAMDTGEMT
jgi:hypothetical protein